MSDSLEKPDAGASDKNSALGESVEIYALPNLFTAGNLFCGFVAVIRCIQALMISQGQSIEFLETSASTTEALYTQAVWFILAAVLFDSLDGRMARITGKESSFGREFDSLADVVSFGMAPALLVFFFLLNPGQDFPLVRTLGGIVGFFYLLCAAVRLARFNVLAEAQVNGEETTKDFLGLPVPAAAGTVASFVLLVNSEIEGFPELKLAVLGLPLLLVVISILMVSSLPYPSFKSIGQKTRLSLTSFLLVLLAAVIIYQFHFIAVAASFVGYILFGVFRAFQKWRQDKRVAELEG
jgi:CDP-diacylglycerol--serine O-phosphatidyltransferase|tara:strand:+ start:3102 stop:3989 length:888 start_codon:yes stop_codon:yes gene_type:complete